MKVAEDGVLELTAEELKNGKCPVNGKWIASQVRSYPLEVIVNSKKLASGLCCPEILEECGIKYRVKEAEPLVDLPVESARAELAEPASPEATAEPSAMAEPVAVEE